MTISKVLLPDFPQPSSGGVRIEIIWRYRNIRIGPRSAGGIRVRFEHDEARIRPQQSSCLVEKCRALLNLVEHERQQHEVARIWCNGYVRVTRFQQHDVFQIVFAYQRANGSKHLALNISSDYSAGAAYDLGGRYGEETWSAADVGHCIAFSQPQFAQKLFGLEGLIAVGREQMILLSRIKLMWHPRSLQHSMGGK